LDEIRPAHSRNEQLISERDLLPVPGGVNLIRAAFDGADGLRRARGETGNAKRHTYSEEDFIWALRLLARPNFFALSWVGDKLLQMVQTLSPIWIALEPLPAKSLYEFSLSAELLKI
jgi:hypothetical protein